MYSEFDEWASWDDCSDVIYDSLGKFNSDDGVMDCEAFYGAVSHISINGGQRQPLDSDLWQPADLLEVFRNVKVIHMTEHIEDAIDIMHDTTIMLNDDLLAGVNSVVCGRCEIMFPQINFDDILHYLESVE